jgi:hypothetical protein
MPFDLQRFRREVLEARAGMHADPHIEAWLRREIEFQRGDGIRVILESKSRDQGPWLQARSKDVLGSELEPEITRLFAGSEEEPTPMSPNTDLARFWLLRIRGLGMLEMQQSPYDLAYFLRGELSLVSAQPDIPYTDNISGGLTPPTPVAGSRVLDRAWSLRTMLVPDAWEYSTNNGRKSQGDGIMVGHPDTGYADHLDLDKGRLIPALGFNFVENTTDPSDPLNYINGSPGHGTATASVILSEGTVLPRPQSGEGGTGDPGKVTGVAPAARLVPIRTARKVWWVFSSNVARAIFHAKRKDCHVVSISMGGRGFRHLQAALHDAVKANVIVVAAAGNFSPVVVWPARYEACIAMAATNIDDLPWLGSSSGPEVDMSAPGEDVWRAHRANVGQGTTDVGPSSGTSYATANAAGVAALWLAHNDRQKLIQDATARSLTLQDMFRAALRNSARQPSTWNPSMFGAGIINARQLLATPFLPMPGLAPLQFQPAPASLKELLDGQGEIDLRQAHELIAPSQQNISEIILIALLGPNAASLRFQFEQWGAELVNLLFDLRRENNPLLNQVRTEEKARELIGPIRRIICQRASTTLREALKCE